ncbi:MAG: PH domain-containing protein [Bdellovibrionales bacterium]
MSSYVKRAMQPNEKVLYSAQLHWIIYKSGICFTLVGALIGHFTVPLVTIYTGPDVASYLTTPVRFVSVALILLGAMQLFFSYIRQISTELVITDQRVIAKHGYISTTSYELMLPKVEGATIDQSILGRLLGYGTLMVKGTGGGISPIDHVAKPYQFHSSLMSALRSAHDSDAPASSHMHD